MQEKNIIFYFTGTNNSLMAAKRIGEALGEYELIALSQFNTREKIEADRVGIVCPVYFWGLPNVVRTFLSKVKIKTGTYVFAVLTMGSGSGNAIPEIMKLLQESGNALSFGAGIRFPDNYSTILGAQKQEKHKSILESAKEELAKTGNAIREKKRGDIPKYKGLTNLLFSSYRKSLTKQDTKFKVEDSCNHCGQCVKICPVQNIRFEEEVPVWQHHCEFCLACLANCPSEAIQIGKKTKGKPKYLCPEASYTRMI